APSSQARPHLHVADPTKPPPGAVRRVDADGSGVPRDPNDRRGLPADRPDRAHAGPVMMSPARYADAPHRRFNALAGHWVLVSPQRAMRPWEGRSEPPDNGHVPRYDPTCRLCPGNKRNDGVRNPLYRSIFVFDNDFPAL